MSTSLARGMQEFVGKLDAPIAAFFTSCVHCGLCAEACLFYTETGDPRYTPIHKLEPLKRVWRQHYTVLGWIMAKTGLSRPVTDEELAEWEDLLYDSCTLCGRCSLICPVGNDIAYMVRKAREGMVASGHSPKGLREAIKRTFELGSPMGVTPQTLRATLKAVEADFDLPIPVDQAGADYLMMLSASEIVLYSEMIGSLAEIFDHAGVSWTLSSKAYEATNAGMQIGSSDLAGDLVQRIVDAAEELGVKTVISPECGHAWVALRWEGPNLIGRPYEFDIKHITEVLDELESSGRIQVEGMESVRATFHDPCQLVRRGGVLEAPRRVLHSVSDIVEMDDHGVLNWCCGGGGGVSANDRAKPLMTQAFQRKTKQIDHLGIERIVTACSNCRTVIGEGLEAYHLDDKIEVTGLTEIVAAHLVKTDKAGSSAGD